jgi:polyribonucleotide nucleotidyltransferase
MYEQKHSITVEELGITIGTGSLAKQANGAVTIALGETTVFVAATAAATIRPDQDWFPLQVDYREKFSAAGRFPGGFFKREGRPSEKEILTSRLCDRPLRPLFPKGFLNEVQVVGQLLTADLSNEPDILMINAASAALMVSDIPWNGPVGALRIGQINGEFVVNPTNEQQFESDLDLIYVGSETEMTMIEGSADQIADERFIEALEYAQEQIQPLLAAQRNLTALVNKPKRDFTLYQCDPEILQFIRDLVRSKLEEAMFQPVKQDRDMAVDKIKEEAVEKVRQKVGEEDYDPNQVSMAFEILQEELYRSNILEAHRRVDDRGPEDLRPIECHVSALPRVHGSAIFQRGETQALVITTLGSTSDNQDMDGLTGGARSKSFILHYNFPHFSVGETGRIMGPGRREVGHGALAERSLLPIIPAEEDFPYTIRLVSEILESNGSTSMASVCGGCLSMMDAGVPITDMVAGISAGLVTAPDEKGKIEKYILLTDIIGSEDHFGDMDFKICGTRKGVTGFQLDLKIPGLPFSIAREAIMRNRETRLKILDIMSEALEKPRSELSTYAPRIHKMQIDPEKIGALIGPGGKTIRRITEISGAEIDIAEDNSGKVFVYSNNAESMQRAIEEIELATGDIEVGKTYRGIVRGVKEFGAFVECLPGKEGLVHVSELSESRVHDIDEVCAIGDEMWVKCIGIDERGRVRLSRRIAMAEKEGRTVEPRERPSGDRQRHDRPRNGRNEGSRGGDSRRPERGLGGDSRRPERGRGGQDRDQRDGQERRQPRHSQGDERQTQQAGEDA